MAHRVVPLKEWVTPNRAYAKEEHIKRKAVIVLSEDDFSWLTVEQKKRGEKLFKEVGKKGTVKIKEKEIPNMEEPVIRPLAEDE